MTRDAALLGLIRALPSHVAPEGTRWGTLRARAINAAFADGLYNNPAQSYSREAIARDTLVRALYPVAFPDAAEDAA